MTSSVEPGAAGAAGADAVSGTEAYEIDEVRDTDVENVVALWRACDLTRPWNDPYRDLADARATSTATVLVLRPAPPVVPGAEAVQEPVGSVMAGFDGHRGWLYYLAVDPSVRGRGHGRRLVVAAEAWLAAQGAVKVQLMVRQTNETVAGFYTALGYADAECVVLGRRLP